MRTEVDRTQEMVERWSSVQDKIRHAESSQSLRNTLLSKRRDLESTMKSCKQAGYGRDVSRQVPTRKEELEDPWEERLQIDACMSTWKKRNNTGSTSRDSANSNIL